MEQYDEPLTVFQDSLPNSTTRKSYERKLAQFFKFLNLEGDLKLQSTKFTDNAKTNPNSALSDIMRYIRYQKERAEKREISTTTLPNYYKPIKSFCEMNDITLNWKKITRTIPKGKRRSSDRIPTLDEIKQLLQYPDRRLKPAILTMVSSGIRLGAWDYLRWGDVTPINRNGMIVAAKIIVYRGERDEYPTFITPESYHAIKEYMDFRASHHEPINKSSWILRDAFDLEKSSRGLAIAPKQLKSLGLKSLIESALWGQGLRKPLENGNKRHEFKTDHGFRKYFKTVCEKHMKTLHVEMLMGHATGMSDNYYRISDDDMLDEYLKAVNALSVFIPPITDNEEIKDLRREVMRSRFEMVSMLKHVISGKLTSEEIDRQLSLLRDKIRVEGEGIVVKDMDGTEILF